MSTQSLLSVWLLFGQFYSAIRVVMDSGNTNRLNKEDDVIVVFIIFLVIWLLFAVYVAVDWAYFCGYDRAVNVVFREWDKDIKTNFTETNKETDSDEEFALRCSAVDKDTAIANELLKEEYNVQLRKVLKDWFKNRNERR
jgi:hypothetical protein